MEQLLEFLLNLHANNNKAWFDAHRAEYTQAKNTFSTLAMQLVDGVRTFDSTIGPLMLPECTYRINRDIRFSPDKRPYKTHFGTFICRGGRKSGYSGYYFHIGIADGDAYPDGHIVAIGNYFTEPKVLKVLREDIDMGGGEFDRIIKSADPRLYLDQDQKLKNVPRGFEPGTLNDEYLKLKNYCLCFNPDRDFILDRNLVGNLLEIFRTATPLLDFVNRAIDWCREQQP